MYCWRSPTVVEKSPRLVEQPLDSVGKTATSASGDAESDARYQRTYDNFFSAGCCGSVPRNTMLFDDASPLALGEFARVWTDIPLHIRKTIMTLALGIRGESFMRG